MERRLTRVEGSSALSVAGSAEAEFAKDIWDVRNIPGAQYPDCNSRHLLRFTAHGSLIFHRANKIRHRPYLDISSPSTQDVDLSQAVSVDHLENTFLG